MNFLISKAVEKGFKKLVHGIIAYFISINLDQFGIKIDEAQATVALFGLLEVLRNVLKTRLNIKWL